MALEVYGRRSDVVYAGDDGRPYCPAMGGKREVGGLKKGSGSKKAKEGGALPKYAAYICKQARHGGLADS